MQEKISRRIFQSGIALVFGYFGIMALINPDLEAAKWLSSEITSIIKLILPTVVFMYLLGAAQVAVAILLVVNKLTKTALLLAALLLSAIIINLGWNEVTLRDLVILSGTLYLYFSNKTGVHGEEKPLIKNK